MNEIKIWVAIQNKGSFFTWITNNDKSLTVKVTHKNFYSCSPSFDMLLSYVLPEDRKDITLCRMFIHSPDELCKLISAGITGCVHNEEYLFNCDLHIPYPIKEEK